MTLSVAIITLNEEANIGRTVASVIEIADEIVIVDSGSTDRTIQIAGSFGEKVKTYSQPWKGFAAQKNLAIQQCSGEWVLSLDADEEVSDGLRAEIKAVVASAAAQDPVAFDIARRNMFLGRWTKHGGFWPDRKLRLFRRGKAWFEERPVHETMRVDGSVGELRFPLTHHAYPTLHSYIEHMNRYSSLGAEVAIAKGPRGFSIADIVFRPAFTFLYNYVLRIGFLDGREGLLLHLYHAVYVSWKYAKAWELSRSHAVPKS